MRDPPIDPMEQRLSSQSEAALARRTGSARSTFKPDGVEGEALYATGGGNWTQLLEPSSLFCIQDGPDARYGP